MMHITGNHTLFMGVGFIFQLLIIGLVIFVIYWVINSNKLGFTSSKEILKRRLAKGEITKKEYRELVEEIDE